MAMDATRKPSQITSLPTSSDENRLSILDLFRAMGDPSRLRIMTLLRRGELAIGEIAQLLEQSQPRVSRHVRILEEAELAERRKEGSWVFVRLVRSPTTDALMQFADQVTLSTLETRISESDRKRLTAVQEEREAAAGRYFAAHAEEWDAIRSLHVAEAEVEQSILAMMRNRRLGHLLDIGTGTGRMAMIMGASATRVTALDRSPEMLRIARGRLSGATVPVELVQGDFTALPLADDSVDSIVMHQVLHYAASPDQVIAEAARVLRPSGHVLIVDFAPHDREELRRDAAHARLGFSDGQIRGWFAASGLIIETVEALTGGALTVKIWLGRRRSDVVKNQPSPETRKAVA